ncbi:MAG: hypothetical protein M1818_003573 [Claussenomyces sp. TS43310]|nr:MAG: hypothetical protein M1818_003573 [Claussenomyces sp. TS43310]
MPKKRHSNLYSKPPSTVHHSPSPSASRSATSPRSNDSPTVNELLMSLRTTRIAPQNQPALPVPAPSLPAPIRQLLDLPDTPAPPPRSRRRMDAFGRRLPAGPAPPRSWLQQSMYAPKQVQSKTSTRRSRAQIDDLPGIAVFPKKRSLMHTCLKRLARDWHFYKEFDRHYLPSLPTGIRMALLSYVVIYGPEDGIGYDGLRSTVRPGVVLGGDETGQLEDFSGNDDFRRLDLSRSIGNSISFKQLQDVISPSVPERDAEDSWETTIQSIPLSLSAPLSVKYLSLSHPPSSISWKNLLNFANSIPTLTHLSLAFWPTPCLTPNCVTASISSRYAPDGQYGATGFYSHNLDNDWSEAANILRRLSNSLYSLEWLDLDGCADWAPALRWSSTPGIDWVGRWGKVRIVRLRNGTTLPEAGEDIGQQAYVVGTRELVQYKERILEGMEVEKWIRRLRGWITVEVDDWEKYDHLIIDKNAGKWLNKKLLDQAKLGWAHPNESTLAEMRAVRSAAANYWD